MTATDSICAPGQGRFARWRALGAALLTLVLMALLPPLLIRAGVLDDEWLVPVFFAPLSALITYLIAINPWQPEMRGRLLTARTLGGRCTVDLNGLTRVGRLVIPGKDTASTVDWLMLADEHGVRLAVRTPRPGGSDYAELAVARTALAPLNEVRVSRWAMKRLRPAEYRPMSYLRAGLIGLGAMVLGVVVIGGSGALLVALAIQLVGEG